MQPSSSTLTPLQGAVERVTYHNPENGYCVLRVKTKGRRELVTLVGHLSAITPGESIEAHGQWSHHQQFGLQFKAASIKTIQPATLEGIEKYLGSGMVKGIGPHFAKKLVEAFQFQVFDIIENNPQALKKVEGIGPIRVKKITTAWKEQKIIRDIMVFLQSHGVSTAKSVRIYKTYGQEAVAKVKANPYQLARDITGIGFKSADLIAFNLGISKTSLIRAGAGLNYVLLEKTSAGHCAYPEEELIQSSAVLLEITPEILKEALKTELQSGRLVREEIDQIPCLYPAGILKCEVEATHLLRRLQESPLPWPPLNPEKALEWVDGKIGIQLAPAQREAVQKSLSSKIMIITGGPGTGKTTLTRAILTILQAKQVKIALCSPTGRAAKRLSECTGMEAKTIHRLLKFDPKKGAFLHDQENPLDIDLLLIDETSMVDISLFYHLLKAVPTRAALIIVGDVDQLPSVGPGQVLRALIESETIPTVRLHQIFRQAAQSQIIKNAHRINEGLMPEWPDPSQKEKSDFHFIVSDEPEATVPKMIELVKDRIPKAFGFDPLKEIQVLCPMNRGILGGRNLNVELQKALNPNPSVKIERFGTTYAPGDKVMVIQNDYDKDVYNGDIGFIESLDLVEQQALIDFDGRQVAFDFNEMDLLTLAYATTIHKAQGSEYPAVLIPLATQHYLMLKKNLVYTGVTRGKKLVVMIGQKKALAIAVKARNQDKRWNKLKERLQSSRPQ